MGALKDPVIIFFCFDPRLFKEGKETLNMKTGNKK